MSIEVTGTVQTAIALTETDTRTWTADTATSLLSYTKTKSYLASGTGANQVNRIYKAQLSLAAGASSFNFKTMALAGGTAPLDLSGAAFAMTRMAEIYVENLGDTVINFVDDASASNRLTTVLSSAGSTEDATVPIRPGGRMHLSAPDATGFAIDASNNLLWFDNTKGSAQDIYLMVAGSQ